ncbi:hypothetical protein T484DRAFT_3013160 [Baffinella frigidus]|nr:hypothetical protein T484DRAFT_3013160 [Cryptophyta sp. CCMP2293]
MSCRWPLLDFLVTPWSLSQGQCSTLDAFCRGFGPCGEFGGHVVRLFGKCKKNFQERDENIERLEDDLNKKREENEKSRQETKQLLAQFQAAVHQAENADFLLEQAEPRAEIARVWPQLVEKLTQHAAFFEADTFQLFQQLELQLTADRQAWEESLAEFEGRSVAG